MTVTISDWDLVREALRRKELRQGLYDEGAAVMEGCLLDLHGEAHRDRRRLENRLFRREMFLRWEREVLGPTISEAFGPYLEAGHGDLITIGYRTTMNLTALIAGIDRPDGTPEETEHLYSIVRKFSEGATAVHSTRPGAELAAEVDTAMEAFDSEFYGPSLRRRRGLLDEAGASGDRSAVPADVLTTLLANEDALEIPPEVMRREVAFYLQAGSHSTANAFTHTADELFRWAVDRPEGPAAMAADPLLLQHCVHESLRLNPASPVAWRRPTEEVTLSDGTRLAEGDLVVLDLAAANRSVEKFGPNASEFDPIREPAGGVPRWGHSFGGGPHACVGAELDGGSQLDGESTELDGATGERLYGTVVAMVSTLLANGGRPDPMRPPTTDTSTSRTHFSSYPVLFDAGAGTEAT